MTDVFSWDSSPEDPFDDDSWMSEPESICNNWRGWKKTTPSNNGTTGNTNNSNNYHHHHHHHHHLNLNPINSSNYYGVSSSTAGMEPTTSYSRHPHNDPSVNISSSSIQNSNSLNLSSSYNNQTGSSISQSNLDQGSSGASNSNTNQQQQQSCSSEFSTQECMVPSLTELAARAVAYHISFEVVERVCSPIPEQLQLRIAYWSFPDNEEDIRLYSCLANGSADEFQKGETLYRCRSVQAPLQIGFHLSATVSASTKTCTVAVTFDRCRITSCNCTCASPSSWCSHVVAVCLHRIYQPHTVRLRAPVSESLTRLSRDQLQKFAQYLISESPQQILPTAQRLLDDLLLNENSNINKVRGAPDPTAGAPANEQTKWCLDELQLHGNIRKIVIKLCIPSPMVYSDVNYLSSAAPPAAAEWSSLLRPLRGREPEGLWNLLSIVREMLRRHDRNAIPLLRILTEELLSCDQILIWWFTTNVFLHRGCPANSLHSSNSSNGGSNNRSMHSNIYASQHACCSLCDEIVVLWRLVTLNPAHSYTDTQTLYEQLKEYHLKTLSVIYHFKPASAIVYNQNYRPSTSAAPTSSSANLNTAGKLSDLKIFSGFKPAMVSCLIDWDSYPIPGVTHQRKNRYYEPSLHDQLNSVNHAITSTAISLRLDPQMLWTKSDHPMYHNQSDQFSDTNSSGDKSRRKKSGNETRNNDDLSHHQRKENESEDLGNQEFWERFSVSSEEENNTSNNNQNQNGNEPGISVSRPRVENLHQNNENVLHEDYQIYVYNNDLDKVKNVNSGQNNNQSMGQNSHSDFQWEPVLLTATMVKPIEDPFEILFARAEALYAHGYVDEACRLSVRLAEELLNNPPDLQMDLNNQNEQQGPSTTTQPSLTSNNQRSSHSKRLNRNRFNPALHQISLLTSATLSKAAFLCQVLSENEDSHLLAFHVGLFGLELVRPPASTKALEVKLAHQEQELGNLLKRIPLCPQALYVLREKAKQLRDGRLTTRGEALLPLSLASYIFEALLLSNQIIPHRLSTDERLVFDAAVAAIGLKAKVAEAEHPLLCEGTRRQRGDLALNLLVHYKDNKQRLDLIMEKLLDQEIHPIFNNNKKSASYTNVAVTTNLLQTKSILDLNLKSNVQTSQATQIKPTEMETSGIFTSPNEKNPEDIMKQQPSTSNDQTTNNVWNLEELQNSLCVATTSSASKENENIKPNSMDSSAPDSTSSDNSPTVSRRTIFHKTGKANSGSESSSSGGESSSSDSLSTASDKKIHNLSSSEIAGSNHNGISNTVNVSNSTTYAGAVSGKFQSKRPYTGPNGRHLANNSPNSSSFLPSGCSAPLAYPTPTNLNSSGYQIIMGTNNMISGHSNFKSLRYKGKRHYPIIPNQPSEASAHFMFELAKTLLAKAGGNNTTVLFTQPPSSQNCRAPHRLLHMCAFQIGLYALGLHNAVSPNWLSRTYSSHVSWITCQAMEIGHQAIEFLIDTWEGHLTPSEVASLADRASRSQEGLMVKAAAELALSCMPHAHALTPSEIQRALIQCKEQSIAMLERACLAVEQAAQGGGVYPEVLFDVARKWYQLYLAEKVCEIQSSNGTTPYVDFDSQQPLALAPELSDSSTVNTDYYDQTNQQSFAQIDNNQSYLTQMDSNYYQTMFQPTRHPYQQDINQYWFLTPTQQRIKNSYQLRSHNSNHKMNGNQQSQQKLPLAQYYRPTIMFDQRNYYPTNNQNMPPAVYPTINYNQSLSSSTTTTTLRAASYTAQYYSPSMIASTSGSSNTQTTGSPMFPSNGNFYYPVANSSQQPPNMAQVMAAATGPLGTAPYSFTTPLSVMRAQLGFIPQGLVAAQTSITPAAQTFRLLNMEQLGQQFQTAGQSNSNPQNGSGTTLQQHNQHNSMPNTAQTILGPRQLSYMHAAYRVGMLAMDTLARRVHDDRPQTRYARNPSYGEDVKWLLFIAKKLGSQYVQEFCLCTLTAVASPFVLYDIIIEAAQSIFQSASNNSAYIQSIRSQILNPLIQKCQQMFTSCIYFKIMHITSSDYDEFIATLRTARAAYQMTPGGNIPFNDLLQSLKRTKTCKKELWQQITNAMQST